MSEWKTLEKNLIALNTVVKDLCEGLHDNSNSYENFQGAISQNII